jgi:subfamily B ATP-binding cassette protein MsbA
MSKNKVTLSSVFKTIVWPRRKIIGFGLLLIVISRLASLYIPYSSQILLDKIVPNKDIDGLFVLIGTVVLAIAIQAVTSFALTKILSVEAQNLISQLRVQVQRKILSLPVSYFDNNKSGALVSRIMTDVEGVRNIIGTGLVQLVGGTITAIISLILLIRINPIMTFSTLIPIGVFAFVAMKAFKKIRPIFKKKL